MLNAFFPSVTLEREEHILSTLGDRRELEEVTRDNDLLIVSKCVLQNFPFRSIVGVPVFHRMVCPSSCAVLLRGRLGG